MSIDKLAVMSRNAKAQIRLMREIVDIKLEMKNISAKQQSIKEQCERWTMPRGVLFDPKREIAVLQKWFDQRSALNLSAAERDGDRQQVRARMDQIRKYEREVAACDAEVAKLDHRSRRLQARVASKSRAVQKLMRSYYDLAQKVLHS